jgi:hypothetical protein
MPCFNLISCNPGLYPSILSLCWKGTHPYSGMVVYITGQSPLETYTLTFIGGGCVCTGTVPELRPTTQNNCTPSYDIFKYQNCETGVFRVFGFPLAAVPSVFKIPGDCDCWTLIGEEAIAEELVTTFDSYADCLECLDSRAEQICPAGERTISYAQMVTLPDSPPPDRGFSKCCYLNVVFGDLGDADPYHNDFTGSWYKRQLPNSTVDFKLYNVTTAATFALNDATYGTFVDFGGVQSELSYYIVDWVKVLSLLGEGNYQIKQELTVAGISVDVFSDTYTLKQFTIAKADGTVRIDTVMDGKLISKDTDFKNSGYTTSTRLRGFFGRAEYSFEQDNLAKRDYSYMQNTMSSKREYKFQGLQLPECITDELFNFTLFGAELFISDYNGNNHSYKYELMPVKLEGNAGTEFFVTDRGVNVNLTFSDRTENDRKINC